MFLPRRDYIQEVATTRRWRRGEMQRDRGVHRRRDPFCRTAKTPLGFARATATATATTTTTGNVAAAVSPRAECVVQPTFVPSPRATPNRYIHTNVMTAAAAEAAATVADFVAGLCIIIELREFLYPEAECILFVCAQCRVVVVVVAHRCRGNTKPHRLPPRHECNMRYPVRIGLHAESKCV